MPSKKYSINWEEGEPVSFEVDGVVYESLDEIPDEADREKLTAMMDGSIEQQFEQEFKDFEKAAEEAKKNAASMEKIVIGAFTGVAVLMLLIAAISSYRTVARMSKEESATGRVVEVGCWAHARRYFWDAKAADEARALLALGFIQPLYRVEAEGKDLAAGARRALRQERAQPVLERFRRWLDEQADVVLPKSPIGEAVHYTRSQWTALTRYLDDGDLAIDNNASERALRRVVTGRKNWLFCGSDEGGKRAAILYSIVATCKAHAMDVWAYLKDVLERIPTHPDRRRARPVPRAARDGVRALEPARQGPRAVHHAGQQGQAVQPRVVGGQVLADRDPVPHGQEGRREVPAREPAAPHAGPRRRGDGRSRGALPEDQRDSRQLSRVRRLPGRGDLEVAPVRVTVRYWIRPARANARVRQSGSVGRGRLSWS